MTKSIFRRASALLLSVMLSASALCSSVTAAETESTIEEAGKPMVYHIDRGRTANLTVYKYEVPDASVAYSGSTGEKDDESHIPEDAKPLKGVTFAAYKFADVDYIYKSEESTVDLNDNQVTTYILNINTKKFHYPDCDSVNDMKEKNRQEFTGTREEIIGMGYSPCGRCKP